MGFFFPVKQYITAASDTIPNYRELLYNDRDSDIINSFNQFFEFTCLMMPKSAEVLQLENVPDMTDVTSKILTKYMPNIKLLNIKFISYKESDGLDNLTKLEYHISCKYCPIRIPKSLNVLAFVHYG
uniref:FBD domain-containing protein n=1 Tax=Strongyloides venezuelensis TaxID=75913 RepID=A0A0K0FJW1_STRVS